MSGLAIAVQVVVDRSTFGDRRQWSFCLRISYVCTVQTTVPPVFKLSCYYITTLKLLMTVS